MKLSLEKKAKLAELSGQASNLLVDIIDEALPETKVPTENDLELKNLLSKMYPICPLLSDSYIQMYNFIQEQKISPDDSYFKRLRTP